MLGTMAGFSGDRRGCISSTKTEACVGTCVVWRQKVQGFVCGMSYFLYEIGGEFPLRKRGQEVQRKWQRLEIATVKNGETVH